METPTGTSEWAACFKHARDKERLRICRLLHDEVGQVLSAVGLQLELLRMDCAQAPELARRIGEAQQLLERALEQVRGLSYDLNPGIVERLGLGPALRRLLERYRRDFRGQLQWDYQGDEQARSPQASAIYQIAEQALDNAVRHSGASEIAITVEVGSGRLRLEVRDNGRGLSYPRALESSQGAGLRLMQHEAERAGLELNLASEPERGTIVTALWPPSAGAARGRRVAIRRPRKPGEKR
ncbi:MAG: sensor histidine kinase [Bryobacteraceae bacterium]